MNKRIEWHVPRTHQAARPAHRFAMAQDAAVNARKINMLECRSRS
jgi:hypothetical protein